mgnify:CR=1 FL=1
MHSLCIYVDLSAREYTAPIHSPGSHPNTSMMRACWTLARILRPSHIHHGRSIPGQLMPAACCATSMRSACTLRIERPRRTAVHFFPHTRPPDTHAHSSPQHSTFTHTLVVGDACLVYQRLLVNSYCTSDLCRPRERTRPPSASCDWRVFDHSKMSDPAAAWFPLPSTPPATSRQKNDTHHGLLRPRAYCASRTHTDATISGAQLLQAARGATSAHSSCKLRMVRQRRSRSTLLSP